VLPDTTPLFEEERYRLFLAGLPDFPNPTFIHTASLGTRFSTHYDPVNPVEIHPCKGSDERFTRKESDMGWNLTQIVNPMNYA
jgi:hypothetical protein